MEQTGPIHTLVVHKLRAVDAGDYILDTGDKQSTATLTVKGKRADCHWDLSHWGLLQPAILCVCQLHCPSQNLKCVSNGIEKFFAGAF